VNGQLNTLTILYLGEEPRSIQWRWSCRTCLDDLEKREASCLFCESNFGSSNMLPVSDTIKWCQQT